MGLRRRVLAILLASRRIRWPGAKESIALPLRVRPAFIAITAVVMVLLALLGFHPTLAGRTRVNDKVSALAQGRYCGPCAMRSPGARVNDSIGVADTSQLLHFVCFGVATGSFVWICASLSAGGADGPGDIDDAVRRQFIWRHATAILTGLTCFGGA